MLGPIVLERFDVWYVNASPLANVRCVVKACVFGSGPPVPTKIVSCVSSHCRWLFESRVGVPPDDFRFTAAAVNEETGTGARYVTAAFEPQELAPFTHPLPRPPVV